jgi:SSS family solute:Na+ symporter
LNFIALTIVVILYLGIIAYLGYLGFRRSQSALDYMVGGRDTHPYIMAMSYGATFISTSAIVGFGGFAGLFGMSLLWLTFLNIAVGIFVAFVFFGKRTRKMGLNLDAHTFPEFLGRRFKSDAIQRFMGIVIFIFMPLYAAAVLIGASKIIEIFVGVPYEWAVAMFSILVAAYVILGGLKGVMYTDALQGSLMFLGMIFLLIVVYSKVGGVIQGHQALTAMANQVPEGLAKLGHTGWASSPKFGSPYWWVIYSSIVMGVGIGVLAQPQLVVRYMTVKSNKELNRATAIGGLFILLLTGTAFVVGALSNVLFFKDTGKIAIAAGAGKVENIIPLFINTYMPSWFVYIFMLVILSAGMSTLSSQFHAIGTSIGRDVFTLGKVDASDKMKDREVLFTRVGIIVSILITALLSFTMTDSGVIARSTAIFFGLMATSFLTPYLMSLYWKGVTRVGALTGMITGVVGSAIAFLFFHNPEAKIFGLAKLLTGNETLIPGIFTAVDPLIYMLPISFIVTLVVSLITPKVDDEILKKSFDGLE